MKTKQYQVVRVLNPQWELDENGKWNFTYETISLHNTVIEAQEAHARIVKAENYPMLPGNYHKYVIIEAV